MKVVEFNGGTSFENSEINMILLDKIKQHERVIEYLVQMQFNNIDRSKPREFLPATLNSEQMQETLNQKLINIYP